MDTIMDECFLCAKDYYCVPVNKKIVSQVEYLLPEITIIKLGVPLRICSVCGGNLDSFNKFKKSSVESSRRLEAKIKGSQGLALHTGSPPVVDNNDSSVVKPEKMKHFFIKEEYLEETPLDTLMHTDRASLNPIVLLERISVELHNQLQNIQMHTDTNTDNIEETFIKEEQIEETPQDTKLYSNILKEKYVNQPEHNIEDEIAIFNTSEEVWERSSADFKEETDGNYSKNIQTDTKKITNRPKHQDELNKKLQENKEHRCNVCTKLFECKTLLSRHMKENHLRCSVCKKIFIHKYDLNKHMALHNGIKNFQCFTCKKRFFNKRNLKEHIKLHSEPKKNETQAKNDRIPPVVNEFQCDLCDKSFTLQIHLTAHMRFHTGVKEFQCDVCDKSFTQKRSLNNHMRIHTGVKDFHCEECDKSFTLKQNLKRHMKMHSGIKEFRCNVCNKLFTQRWNLKMHMIIHSTINQFKCDVCGKLFTQKYLLTRHYGRFHKEIQEFPNQLKKNHVNDYRCEICNKTFTRKNNLNMHMRVHSDVKEFQCDLCDKLFSFKSALKYHMKTHSGKKEFRCDICGNEFWIKSKLNYHMKLHTRVKEEVRCDICNKTFALKDELNHHMKIHSYIT